MADDIYGEGSAYEGGISGDMSGDNQQDIQELLDLGYEQLDGFRVWVDERLEMGSRIAEQDCFNAEFLLDYLANYQRKGIENINEFELRWFMLSHYIRKAMADDETEMRLPDSLQRFFGYLRSEHRELVAEWVGGVLDDTGFYEKRRRDYAGLNNEDERAWKIGFQEWSQELEEDLDTRCLWLPRDIEDGLEWKDAMGWREATLFSEANANWQRERIRLLREGYDYDTVRRYLDESYYAWLDTPQSRLEEQSPREVIQSERLANEEEEDYDDPSESEL